MLKKANIYEENRNWYMHLEWEEEGKHGKKLYVVPKLQLPRGLINRPVLHCNFSFYEKINPPYFIVDEQLTLYPGKATDPRTGKTYDADYMSIDLEAGPVEITVKEIEKQLGFKIKIISEEEKK